VPGDQSAIWEPLNGDEDQKIERGERLPSLEPGSIIALALHDAHQPSELPSMATLAYTIPTPFEVVSASAFVFNAVKLQQA
jgi:hypothetical protein